MTAMISLRTASGIPAGQNERGRYHISLRTKLTLDIGRDLSKYISER